ncbi:hypothetical protein [Photobacterium aquae]|uniref:hypothetical protein n=1 Tax=Photobacterium aquae TaxID=1195763 RepID=UPI0012EEA285|nr:hypothetical protein [Photobacterium aquae]
MRGLKDEEMQARMPVSLGRLESGRDAGDCHDGDQEGCHRTASGWSRDIRQDDV